jgi:hypothetical protein
MKSLGLSSCSTLEGWDGSTNKQNAIWAGIFFIIFLLTFWWYSSIEKTSYDSSSSSEGLSQNNSHDSRSPESEIISIQNATEENPALIDLDPSEMWIRIKGGATGAKYTYMENPSIFYVITKKDGIQKNSTEYNSLPLGMYKVTPYGGSKQITVAYGLGKAPVPMKW